ncbi:hypothetical protein, partial [Nonomuraea sp. NPDC052265]|uniref:hypothetical protein n=1 Tax=Nonomuraea sp. NPDC052265 TaxID=3364374 RepID=UPI0037C86231
MLRTLLDIAMNWTVRGKDPRHVRCRRCGEIHSEGAGGGHFLTTASFTVQRLAEGQAMSDSLTTPAEWVCPCGRRSPLEPADKGLSAGGHGPVESWSDLVDVALVGPLGQLDAEAVDVLDAEDG